MWHTIIILMATMLHSCGNNVQPKEVTSEEALLRETVIAVSNELGVLGFPVDVSQIKIEMKEASDMINLFNEISDESRQEVNNYTPGPIMNPPKREGSKFRDGADSRLAFYDPNSRSIVIRKGSLDVLTKGYLAHELAHAYQDQKWGFGQIWQSYRDNPSRESFNIAQFIIEGHAELVRHAYEQQYASPHDVKEISLELGKMSENDCIPCHSQQSIATLPYVFGMRFLVNQYREGGWPKVEDIFSGLPASTEQIIHENKFEKDQPEHLSLPVWNDRGSTVEPVLNSSLGEAFLLAKLLTLPIPPEQALSSASGWDGDIAQLYRLDDGREAMVWRIAFDRVQDAQQFEDAIKNFGTDSQAFRMGRMVDWIVTKYPDMRKSIRLFLSKHPQHLEGDLADEQTTTEQETQIQNDAQLFDQPYFVPKIVIGPKR